ncbi:Gfo/Idh/MocA family protein [Lewinella sp. W8]|uniref:Gfo/Idh/MocA family protein n=1 Tax=Lewinella sp. W8 TaxID=2528208 RepID=UPI0010676901|nr:Gfo/Idh/MocA family oxidoreductase [Lewinella sp. W8]MTB53477.1 twin-arginine translocation signal domain-containing protein [Lewinella sp. W8]
MPKQSNPNRRKFIKTAATAAAAFTIVPRHVLGGPGFTAPSDTVNVAAIGAGGKGRSNVNAVASQNVVALCDVDDRRAADTYANFPKAKTYRDYRKMLDEMGKDIDAVMISTPDHTHAITGLACMALGKHVYIEKPLAHSIAEVRALTEAAAANPKLITQMGNQGASGEGIRKTQEIYEAGLLGDVHTVYAWSNRPVWPQGGPAPTVGESVPDHLDWNLWLGPAADRPYHSAYHPFAWRGYWDFGTGALGDMGCHIIDTPFYILELGYPTEAEASVGQVFSQNWNPDYNPESCPPSTKIHIQFPARGEKPPVELIWMDGGILPRRPDELLVDELLGDGGNGIIMEGTKGKLIADVYGANPRLLPTKLMNNINIPETLPRVTTSHQMDWINGIKEGYQPSSHFAKAGPLAETVLMGNLAVRGYSHRFPKQGGKPDEYIVPGRTKLEWDGEKMEVTNVPEMNYFVQNNKTREF